MILRRCVFPVIFLPSLFSLTWGQPASPASAASRPFLATVAGIRAATAELELKREDGSTVPVKLDADTVLQRVLPGAKDLRGATAIAAGDILVGDRVLVTLMPAPSDSARRIVVMPAEAIEKRQQADRQDWTARGVAGVVVSRSGDKITLRRRSMMSESQAEVTISAKTVLRRYAPDSVKFSDARPSSASEVRVGDQLRARGIKSGDGAKLEAEEVVFGTFLARGGPITKIDAGRGEIVIDDLVTHRPLTIRLTRDSQLKRMPAFPGPGAGTKTGPGGGAMPGSGGPPPGFAGPPPQGMGGPPPPGAGGPPPPDLAQIIERLPASKLDDFGPGESIVVSSTKGSEEGVATAITVLGNAGFLIRMAQMQAGQSARNRMPDAMGPGMGPGSGPSMGGGLGDLGLTGIMP